MVKNSKEKRRGGCGICKKAERNPIGHLAEWRFYPGGPFYKQGVEMKGRISTATKAKKEAELRNKGVDSMSEKNYGQKPGNSGTEPASCLG